MLVRSFLAGFRRFDDLCKTLDRIHPPPAAAKKKEMEMPRDEDEDDAPPKPHTPSLRSGPGELNIYRICQIVSP